MVRTVDVCKTWQTFKGFISFSRYFCYHRKSAKKQKNCRHRSVRLINNSVMHGHTFFFQSNFFLCHFLSTFPDIPFSIQKAFFWKKKTTQNGCQFRFLFASKNVDIIFVNYSKNWIMLALSLNNFHGFGLMKWKIPTKRLLRNFNGEFSMECRWSVQKRDNIKPQGVPV